MSSDARKPWHWIGWNANKERICDTGIVYADTESEATNLAWICAGGPHCRHIKTFTIKLVDPTPKGPRT